MDSRKLYMGTNLKMYKTGKETLDYLKELSQLTMNIDRDRLELFVIPSFTALQGAQKAGIFIAIGAQNMCWEEEGAFTGEISPRMLQDLGVTIVEIGHSERRHIFGENDQMINWKVLTALRYGFTALLCIGETMEQKSYGVADEVLCMQLKIGLHQVRPDELRNVRIAYEPVWAIGENGVPATADYVQARHRTIRQTMQALFGEPAKEVPLLYGGSVHPENARALLSLEETDGLFVGRHAWNAREFYGLIRIALS